MEQGHQEERISQFIDNELAQEETTAMFAHLGGCSECQSFLLEALQLRSHLQASRNIMIAPVDWLRPYMLSSPLRGAKAEKKNIPWYVMGHSTHTNYSLVTIAATIAIAVGLFFTTRLLYSPSVPSVIYVSTTPECEVIAPTHK